MKKHIWIIGAARSGTTWLAEFIGKYTDHTFIERHDLYPLDQESIWKFPEPYTSVSFKFNHNFLRTNELVGNFKESFFVHIFRDPKHVVYSMIHPKKDSIPPRDYWKDDFEKSLNLWFFIMEGCLNVKNCNIAHIRYEKINENVDKLGSFLNMNLNSHDLNFKNRNEKGVDYLKLQKLEALWRQPRFRKYYNLRLEIENLPDFYTTRYLPML